MEKAGHAYYERGVKFFELEQYENAVEDWIHAYELGYKKEQILQNLYQCFIVPNDYEFQKNYEENYKGITYFSYNDCVLDFIPVSYEKYYIFNREEEKFEGSFVLKKTLLQGEKFEFKSVLYTDEWDIRQILVDVEKENYGLVYLLLGEFETKFISFLKLPLFKELYMGKIILFHDALSMKQFFLNHSYDQFPKQVVTSEPEKYVAILGEIQKEKQNLKGKNILLLMGQSQYGALRRVIKELADSFRKIGYNTLVLDLLQESFWQQLCVAKERYEFEAVISCNLMGIDSEIIRSLGKKFCSIMGDHPIWHSDRFEYADKDTILWYGDWNNANYVRTYYPNVGRCAISMGSSDYLEEKIAYADRKYDLVFIGGYSRPQDIYTQLGNMYNGSVWELVKAFIEKLIEYPDKTYEGALRETLDDYNLNSIVDEKFVDTAIEFSFVDKYIRAYFRDKVIRQIVQNDIEIHVSGNGWENFESEYKDNIIIENNDWYTGKKLIANAKITLNILPWFKAGFHDRAIASLLSGSVLLTDSSKFIESKFIDMENIAIYHLEDLESLPQKIKYLLTHEEIAERIARNGHEIGIKDHTWVNWAKEMSKVLKEEMGDTTELDKEGEKLSISVEGACRKEMANDFIEELWEIDKIVDSFQTGTTSTLIGAKDYRYCVSRIKEVILQLTSEFPTVEVGGYVWNIIANLHDPVPEYTSELIKMQIGYLVKEITWKCLR